MAITEDRLSAVDDTATTVETSTTMRVKKRNGSLEPVDLNKIVNAVARASEGLMGVDPMVVSTRTISALADGSTTQELDELSIRTAAGLIVEEPNYSKLAARMLATYVDKEVRNQNVPWFSESVALGHNLGLIGDEVLEFVTAHERALLRTLSRYPEVVGSAASELEPHQLAHYLRDLANDLHTYYNAHQFLVDDASLRAARLALVSATRQVLANGLAILGVSAPAEM